MKKKLLIAIVTIFLAGGAYFGYKVYFSPDNYLKQIYLVPRDAVYIVESDNPVQNWNKFSKSAPWQFLRMQPKMKEIEKMAHVLDSMINENKRTLDILGKRNLMISAHITRKNEYDFLYIVDLEKVSKTDVLKDQIETILKASDYKVTSRNFKSYKILELFDPAERSTLHLSFIDNHLVCSFTGLLVEKAIEEKDLPVIGRNLYFLDIEKSLRQGGLCRIYVNYKMMPEFMGLSGGGVEDPLIGDICRSLHFTGLNFDANDKQLSLKGYTNINDSSNSYLPALLRSGQNKITAQKVLSHRTAFFMTMGFDDADKFMDNVELLLNNDPDGYQYYTKNKNQIESFLKIDIRQHFLSWMEGEVVFAQNTPGMLGRQNEFVAVIKMKDKGDAVKNLNFIEERIRKKTPVRFKTIEYEGFEIHFMEMRGFFRLMFGKMFDKLNKPYYTIIDDYAVFSNSTATLLSMIEDYRLGQTLDKDEDFKRFFKEFNNTSSIFAYTNTPKFFPLWKDFVSPTTWNDLQNNEAFFFGFPQTAFQLTGEKNLFDTRFVAEFALPEKESLSEKETLALEKEEQEETLDFASREDTLKNLELFYVEQMGNVFTEFYEDGAIRSKTEMSKGIRDGKYKAFYPNGKLSINGKFKKNKRHGTWRYYDEDEKLIRKEKWKNGEQTD